MLPTHASAPPSRYGPAAPEGHARPVLSIIIVGWNCGGHLEACLTALGAHPPSRPFEIIVVDNASTDGTAALVRQRFPTVRVIQNARNVGFQRGNNQGLAVARGDRFLLLNPDTAVLAGSLDTLLDALDSHPDIGAVSPRCVYPDGRLQWSVAPFPSLSIMRAWFQAAHPRLIRLAGLRPAGGAPPADLPSREQDYAYGGCLAVKREVVEAVGPMDEGFFVAGGEIAWSREMQRHGWKTYFVAEATIVHRESVTRASRGWVSELDWVLAHRRLLYLYDGLRSGVIGDLLFSAHLCLRAGQALWGRFAWRRPPGTGERAGSL
jgi:GT2 family glycosyltransferase